MPILSTVKTLAYPNKKVKQTAFNNSILTLIQFMIINADTKNALQKPALLANDYLCPDQRIVVR